MSHAAAFLYRFYASLLVERFMKEKSQKLLGNEDVSHPLAVASH